MKRVSEATKGRVMVLGGLPPLAFATTGLPALWIGFPVAGFSLMAVGFMWFVIGFSISAVLDFWPQED